MSFHSWLQNLRSALDRSRHAPRDEPGAHHAERDGYGRRRRGSLRAATHRPNLEVLEDRLTPSFSSWFVASSDPPAGVEWAPLPPLLADFTSDGILDRIRNSRWGVAVEPGLGDGTFAEPISSGWGATDYLAVADFNGDGRLDVVATDSNWAGDNAFGSVLLGRGDGTFHQMESFDLPIRLPERIGTGDFNADGRQDLAIAGHDWDGAEVFEVLINDGYWPALTPALRIHDATVTEGNTGTRTASFIVTLSYASTQPVTVSYTTAHGTAASSDYQATSGTLTFVPGETSNTITVPVIGDRLGEPNETFVVNLSNPTNATITDDQGVGTIVEDEPRISISDMTKKEGKKGQTTLFTFTVTLSAAYDQAVTMSYATANGTAKTSDNDYVARSGTLTFAPGETTKTITIEVKGDSKKEADEYFYLDLFGLSNNAVFTKNRGLGTILNDD